MSFRNAIKEQALEAGFDLVGIAPPGAWRDLAFSRTWVNQGYGGEMRYLENPQRDDARRVLPSVKSIICVGLIYNAPYPFSTEIGSQKLEVRNGTSAVGRQLSVTARNGLRTTERKQPALTNFDSRVSNAESPVSVFEAPVSSGSTGPHAWISRYAWGQDYHEVMRAKLEQLRTAVALLAPGVETRVYVDTGPIVERAFARLSGIGWMGKNTCLINESRGSWFFLGVLLTNLEVEPDLPAPDRCGSCTRCLEACPTGALVRPYVMDASRCIAYFTIELKGSIPEEFRSQIGANVFGCDICQDVCPWNSRGSGQSSAVSGQLQERDQPPSFNSQRPGGRGRPRREVAVSNLPEFQPLQVELAGLERVTRSNSLTPDSELPAPNTRTFSLFNPAIEALAALSEKDFRRIFARSPVKRAKYRGWLRNLCVAMGNSGDRRFVPWLERAREYPDPVVREHAQWALNRLGRKS